MLRVQEYTTAAAFLQRAETELTRHELENNLILGVPLRVREEANDAPENLYLTVMENEALVGAAAMTPPHNLILHVESDATGNAQTILNAIAHAVLPRKQDIPGMIGRIPWVDWFARIWEEQTGRRAHLAVHERLFELREVIAPPRTEGRFRMANAEDTSLAVDWFIAFAEEAMPADDVAAKEQRARSAERMEHAVQQGRIYFWEASNEDGWRPICLVGKSRALSRGCTIGPVYTPPAERGKGYASSATAALSTLLLEEGWEYTTLFTDLSNPVSNSIYQKIGYRPVCDYAEWRIA